MLSRIGIPLLLALPLFALGATGCGSAQQPAVLLGLQCDLTVQAVGAAPSVFTLSAENVYSAPTATLSSGGKTACQLQNVSDPPQSYEFKDTEPCGETQLGEILISTDGANVSGSATLVTGAKALISGSCQALYGA
jgi:hypothetical protein